MSTEQELALLAEHTKTAEGQRLFDAFCDSSTLRGRFVGDAELLVLQGHLARSSGNCLLAKETAVLIKQISKIPNGISGLKQRVEEARLEL